MLCIAFYRHCSFELVYIIPQLNTLVQLQCLSLVLATSPTSSPLASLLHLFPLCTSYLRIELALHHSQVE
ncbi:hypothetical protein BRADI_4g33425v3 [Brachypodium distachyon]|uniref:Uncharacterized protein n=1 Tax=Brachypodium distachyon TaxID=15368 RepID=A0A2K2CS02_BRADI|nr:hypothetical protein BRADI_4g33425v3 [Brachypodium distachyon]